MLTKNMNWLIKIIMILLLFHMDTVEPYRQIVYNDTIFGIFIASNDTFDRENGVRNCISWGGNLATIKSVEEDAQVFNLTNSTHYECWIGLEKNVINPGAEGYSWVDGSNSLYRKFSSSASPYNRTFMKFRPNNGHSLTEGWMDDNLDDNTNCYLCGKLANSRGCDFNNSGFCYRTYQMDTTINWYDAQSSCVDWGGNLASIHSETEDELLYRRRPFTGINCWIGMYTNVTGNTVWNDGTDLSFTNRLPSQTVTLPSCVEWNDNGQRRWLNTNCSTGLKCYICKRDGFFIANKRLEREITYNGSIYSYYTFNRAGQYRDTTLRFSCIFTGGILATIESLEVDQLLYDLAVSNDTECWIGLEKRTRGSETSIWEDGSLSSYRNIQGYTSTSDDITSFYSLRARNGSKSDGWDGKNRFETLSCYICQRPVNIRDCQFINNGSCYRTFQLIHYKPINWYDAQSSCVKWGGNLVSITSENENTLLYLRTPYSAINCWIGLTNSNMTNGAFYWNDGEMFNYSMWATGIPNIIGNADGCGMNKVGKRNEWGNFDCSHKTNCYICKSSSKIQLNPVPEVTVTYGPTSIQTYTEVYPNTIQLSIQGLKQDFTLSSNIEGRWRLPDGSYRAGSTLSYPYLIQQYTGLYTFLLYNWEGVEVPAVLVDISIKYDIGIFIRTPTSQLSSIANGFRLFLNETITTLLCVGHNISSIVQWYSHFEQNSSTTQIKADTGVNSYNIDINNAPTSTYLTCEVDGSDSYTIFVAGKDTIVQVFKFDEPISYTLGSPSLLYYSNASIPDSLIRWTTETVMEGDVHTFNPEYTNPVLLSTVFSDVGGGQHTFTCFYRNSTAMVLGSVVLNLKDTETVTISYMEYQKTFSDINNPFFPIPRLIEITLNTSNVIFECSLPECVWKIEYNDGTIANSNPSSLHVITFFQQNDEGIYSLIRKTQSGKDYICASVNLNAKPLITNNIQGLYIYIAIFASVTMCLISALIISVFVIVCILKKRRKSDQFASKKFMNDVPVKPSEVIENQNLSTHDAQDNTTIKTNYENFTEEIDETTFINSADSFNYENVNINKDDDANYEKFPDSRMTPLQLDAYKMHVNELWQNKGSLENEYETLGGNVHRYNCTIATLDQNRIKNRFKLIYPYDRSRVMLNKTPGDPSSDYINASYIPGFYVEESFIAAQAPKDVTLKSFWQMIIENDVSNIVMLTNLVESGRIKCEAYYPVKEGKKLVIGQYEIVLSKEDVLTGYTIRILTVTSKGVKREIKQFHFTAWPDHDVTDLHDELLLFVEKVHTHQIKSDAPILVHCSAGVGRSGTFLALFNLSAAIKDGKAICIYKLVHEMREHRPQMVQTFAQYKLIYLSVLEMLLGNMSIPNNDFTKTYEQYMQSESEGYVSVFFQQFSELNYQCEKGFIPICTTALDECNKDKNPILSVLPYDKNRVTLFSPHWGGDYINATCIDGNEYIITITPTQSTLQDFFQLIYQVEPSLVIFLATPKELRLIQDGKSDRVVYWPERSKTFNTNAFTLTSQSNEKFSSLTRNKINLIHNFENKVRTFTQIISTKWNESGEPELGHTVVLLNSILKQKQDDPAAPIIFHCTDGAGKTGVLFTVFKAILESREKNYIDIFHIVKKLRNERMNFVSTLNNYLSCFSLMSEYLSNTI